MCNVIQQVDTFQIELTELKILYYITLLYLLFLLLVLYIKSTAETKVISLAEFAGNIVLVKQNNLLACAFHSELTDDTRVMQLFLEMC